MEIDVDGVLVHRTLRKCFQIRILQLSQILTRRGGIVTLGGDTDVSRYLFEKPEE